MDEAGPATARAGSPARPRVRRAGPLLVAFGRCGHAVEGRVFVLVGALVVRVALGRGGVLDRGLRRGHRRPGAARAIARPARPRRPHVCPRRRHPGGGGPPPRQRARGRFHAITRRSSLVEAAGASRDGFGDRAGLLAGLPDGAFDQAVFAVLA